MSTPHVRQFIRVGLGGLCHRHGCGILLIAHPSASAMASGDGGGFSTAWNNAVRSRWYLRRPKSEDAEELADRRILEVKKANYGPSGGLVPLIYQAGRFILDPDPVEENVKVVRSPKTETRMSMAVMAFFKAEAASGQVVSFGRLFEKLQKAGDIPAGDYQIVRKPLQRSFKELVKARLLVTCDVPRGYRMAPEERQ